MGDGDYVLACDGATVLGIGCITGPYQYSGTQEFPHERPVDWLDLGEWRLPTIEGLRTTVHEYRKHFDNLVAVERHVLEAEPTEKSDRSPNGSDRTHATLDGGGKDWPHSGSSEPQGAGHLVTVLLARARRTGQSRPCRTWRRCGTVASHSVTSQTNSVSASRDTGPTPSFASVRSTPATATRISSKAFVPRPPRGHWDSRFRTASSKTLCWAASEDPEGRYYLIVDEINRGDIPRIFGELLTLLDKPKRGLDCAAAAQRRPLRGARETCSSSVR